MRKRDFESLLDVARREHIDTLLITHGDLLARFGMELIQKGLSDGPISFIILNDTKNMTLREELTTDMMSLCVILGTNTRT